MINIILNSFKENVRNKTLYVVSIVSLIFFSLILTGGGLAINGKHITNYNDLIPVGIQLINFMGCLIALFISMNTIPKEYERKTTHLILIRGIKKEKLNLSLCLSNVLTSVIAVLILSISIYILTILKGNYEGFIRITISILLIIINVATISAITSLFSMLMPSILTGFFAFIIYILGIFHNQLNLLSELTHGITKLLVKFLTLITPDFYSISTEAGDFINYGKANITSILLGLLYLYIILIFFLIPFRKEV